MRTVISGGGSLAPHLDDFFEASPCLRTLGPWHARCCQCSLRGMQHTYLHSSSAYEEPCWQDFIIPQGRCRLPSAAPALGWTCSARARSRGQRARCNAHRAHMGLAAHLKVNTLKPSAEDPERPSPGAGPAGDQRLGPDRDVAGAVVPAGVAARERARHGRAAHGGHAGEDTMPKSNLLVRLPFVCRKGVVLSCTAAHAAARHCGGGTAHHGVG